MRAFHKIPMKVLLTVSYHPLPSQTSWDHQPPQPTLEKCWALLPLWGGPWRGLSKADRGHQGSLFNDCSK